jgi:hypothetical protein
MKPIHPEAYSWRKKLPPIDLQKNLVFIRTPCKRYMFAIIGCKGTDDIQRHERLFYRCLICPPEEVMALQGPHPHPKNWFIFDNPTSMLRQTAKYKGQDQRWTTLRVPKLLVNGKTYGEVPLRYLSKRSEGPGFLPSPSSYLAKLMSLRNWTKSSVGGKCRSDKAKATVDLTLANLVK